MLKIIIADDHQAIVDGIVSKLGSQKEFSILSTFNNGNDVLAFAIKNEPDIIISDIEMPGISGLRLLHEIQAAKLKTKLIFLTMHDDAEFISVLLSNGLAGYVLKSSPLSELIKGIWLLEQKPNFVCTGTDELLKKRKSYNNSTPKLTKREIQILQLVASDYRNREIAEMLNVELSTVETHKKNLLRKINVKSAIGLTKYAIEKKIISL